MLENVAKLIVSPETILNDSLFKFQDYDGEQWIC